MFDKRRLKRRSHLNTEYFTIKGKFYCKIIEVHDVNTFTIIMKPFKSEGFFKFKARLDRVQANANNYLEDRVRSKRICDIIKCETFHKILSFDVDRLDSDGSLVGDIQINDQSLSSWLVDSGYAEESVPSISGSYKEPIE